MTLKALVALLSLLPSEIAAETVLGAYIFHRHGDRTAKTPGPTSLTALGADELFTSGTWFRNQYISANSTSQIFNVAPDIALLSQLAITAPADNVLQNSANVFLQGIYPPAGNAAVQTLADGTETQAPLSGYQYIPVNIVSSAASTSGAENSGWLQGSSGCGNAVVSSNRYFSSQEYIDTLNRTGTFYEDLLPVINSTFASSAATYKNAYTSKHTVGNRQSSFTNNHLVYDYIHVSQIHNATIPSDDLLTNETVHQVQTLADAHEWGLAYNESEPVRSIAGAVLAAQILSALNTTLTAPVLKKSATKLNAQFGAYGTFMAFFGLANLQAASEDFRGIVDYASSMTFELVTNATVNGTGTTPASVVDPADVSVRFLFANGSASDSNAPRAFPLFGRNETLVSWDAFSAGMAAFAVGDTPSWCTACGNTTGVCASGASTSGSGSGSSGSASGSASGSSGGKITPGIAAAIGILSMFGLILLLGALAALLGFRLVKKGRHAAPVASGTTSDNVKSA